MDLGFGRSEPASRRILFIFIKIEMIAYLLVLGQSSKARRILAWVGVGWDVVGWVVVVGFFKLNKKESIR